MFGTKILQALEVQEARRLEQKPRKYVRAPTPSPFPSTGLRTPLTTTTTKAPLTLAPLTHRRLAPRSGHHQSTSLDTQAKL
ncbi:hypothetical protein SPRG_07468 [Saprolegnia parasitica CBS 223.65]|uniref:Uncharacterized protein n=1 Tax=Saprolegnia parasitica (strain CBS 223.65) TaxID=695850 RepID=A0A067C903_SAPPC|nr:hypothetical protein SPRG_07468 [Saprolegnia parasitica CBS 223.65]KDO27219.1 hypothetical protein SPRG_07468 [Saprolegnia parasitica CBS 223.65]|eukprot:XP_012201997.1 hypothetical protein SPRG_07468 [Saprolegnia parasitica CBS 223.65]